MTDIRKLEAEALAMSFWLVLNEDQKAIIKFGMVPAEIAAKFEELGFGPRETALALMKSADVLGGGMVV